MVDELTFATVMVAVFTLGLVVVGYLQWRASRKLGEFTSELVKATSELEKSTSNLAKIQIMPLLFVGKKPKYDLSTKTLTIRVLNRGNGTAKNIRIAAEAKSRTRNMETKASGDWIAPHNLRYVHVLRVEMTDKVGVVFDFLDAQNHHCKSDLFTIDVTNSTVETVPDQG